MLFDNMWLRQVISAPFSLQCLKYLPLQMTPACLTLFFFFNPLHPVSVSQSLSLSLLSDSLHLSVFHSVPLPHPSLCVLSDPSLTFLVLRHFVKKQATSSNRQVITVHFFPSLFFHEEMTRYPRFCHCSTS